MNKRFRFIGLSVIALALAIPGVVKAKALVPAPHPAFSQDRDRDRWDTPPAEYRDEVQRRGYHEGVEAARRDFNEHRRSDADDHDAYRHPPVEGSARNDFREGFREGYRRAMEHLRSEHDHDIR
jgi:hypothetical protein